MIGAPKADADIGAAYVFARQGNLLTQLTKLTPSDGLIGRFGDGLALGNGIAVIGAPTQTNGGAAYLFARSAGVFNPITKLVPAQLLAGDEFGKAIAISEQRILIGAPKTQLGACCAQGTAYLYFRNGSGWGALPRLNSVDQANADEWGSAVWLGDKAWLGAPLANSGANVDAGAALSFVEETPEFVDGFE